MDCRERLIFLIKFTYKKYKGKSKEKSKNIANKNKVKVRREAL